MTEREALKLALETFEELLLAPQDVAKEAPPAITAIREALAQPEQEPVVIWYMRDNHTFKRLSADVSNALIEIEQEFNAGYTYGMLCSKRKGFPNVHASGEKKRLEFFAECKKTLEEWLPNTTPPQRTWVGLTDKEMREAMNSWSYSQRAMTHAEWVYAVQRATEARLKEKNT